MGLFTKEHYEILEAFEATFKGVRLDKEPKEIWSKGHVYQSGETNTLFLAFRQGVSFGRSFYA